MNPILIVPKLETLRRDFQRDGEMSEHDCLVLVNGELSVGDRVKYGAIQDVLVVRKERQEWLNDRAGKPESI